MRPAQLESVQRRQGQRAGIVSRLAADVIDVVVVVLVTLLVLVVVWMVRVLFVGSSDFESITAGSRGLFLAVLLLYLIYGWGLNGQTFGKLVLGLRVVRGDGGDVSFARGSGRAVLYIVFPIGILWALVSSKNASVQDHLLDTAVVHDWGFAVAPQIHVHRVHERPRVTPT